MTLTAQTVPKEIEKKILTAIELKKELEQYEKDIKEALLEAMEANDIYSIKNDKYSVTLTTRKTYKAEGSIPVEFQKLALDTAKVASAVTLYGEIPKGITQSETKYITWRAK
jgi:23S rRNA maturation-related 3'-5' exoribonuclease YhaM